MSRNLRRRPASSLAAWWIRPPVPHCRGRRRIPGAGLLLALSGLALLLPGAGQGAWPPDERSGQKVDYADPANWPKDPGYAGQWQSHSFAPKTATKLDARTQRLGVGAHYDRAWAKTTGDPRVVIAVLDSGAYWDNRDLVNKWFLNQGELPLPDDACQTPAHRGAGNRVYDANGDGVFNVQDYTNARGHEQPEFARVCDPRLVAKGDVNKNQILDPQDLIAAFSDKLDDDGNGYVDDIAGWDFFRDDNDAYDEARFGHGNGEAQDSSAEADNGLGGTGICPRCRVVPLRVGDSFVADATDFGMAATYAVDLGAAVIQEALGTVNNSAIARYAIDYAYDNHVTVIASAADENSFHQNFPAAHNHAVVVHAIRYNADRLNDATNAFTFNNCTNYGAQLQLSVPGNACSSEATGRGAGLAGLIYSAALQADLPALPPLQARGVTDPPAGEPLRPQDRARRLTAEEVRQVLIGTVDQFYDPSETNNPEAFPTGPGFVRRFGYGRVNGRSAVDRVLSGALPPQVGIEGPEWFDVLHVGRGDVPLKGRIAVRDTHDQYDFILDYAPGVDPAEASFKTLAHGELLSGALDGVIASLPVDRLQVDSPVPSRDDAGWQPDDPAHTRTVTLRLRAIQRSTDVLRNGLVGEARRAVHVVRDPDLLPGYPRRLTGSVEASPKTADLLGDGRREVIVADAAGLLHALRADGSELPGWPVALQVLPALRPERHAAAPAWGPGSKGARVKPPGLAAVAATPAIGDVNGDGKPEVVVATWDGAVLAVRADGTVLPGFPAVLPGLAKQYATVPQNLIDDGVFASPVLVDLDGDKRLDIVVGAMDGQVYAWRGDGTALPGWPVTAWDTSLQETGAGMLRQRARVMGTPAVGDLNRDGVPDVVVSTAEDYSDSGRLYALDGRGGKAPGGAVLPGFPVKIFSKEVLPLMGTGLPNAPALADVDGDGVPEIFTSGIGGGMTILRADGTAYAVRADVTSAAYGKGTDAREGATVPIISNPAIGDIDHDGQLDLVMPTAGANAALSMLQDYQRVDYEMHISAWDLKTGQQKAGFPRVIEDWLFFMNPALADVDGDGQEEVIAGSSGYWVHAWNAAGKEAAGFPHLTGGWILASPTVGDLDGDGKLELIAATRQGFVYAWRLRGSAKGRISWDGYHHDNQNTGNAATPIGQGGDEISAGCQAAPGAGSGRAGGATGLWLAGGLIAGLWARRRRGARAV